LGVQDSFGNNNKDNRPNDIEDDPGTDPYGFVMLDGPPGSIDNAFDAQYTIVTRDEESWMATDNEDPGNGDSNNKGSE
jgi:hypothetical protein